jgi:type IV secretion system protein VirD4
VRRADPPTLFLVDESARLGHFPLLEAAVTLCRGYGLRVWTFWQDLQQLRNSFPGSWQTLVNNSAFVQTFGISTKAMADQWSEFLTHAPAELMNLDSADQVLLIHGQGEQVSRRCDYLGDALFRGLAQPNPFFALPAEAETERRPPPAPDGASLH